jgi:hypothetical protein
MAVVVVAYGIKEALNQSQAAVVAEEAAQIKTQIDLEYGAVKVLPARDSQVVRDYDTIEKAIMLTPAAEVAEQAALACTAWTLIMMELQQTVAQVLLVIFQVKHYIGVEVVALDHTYLQAVQVTAELEVVVVAEHTTDHLKCLATFLDC